jgi:hypothetical protein
MPHIFMGPDYATMWVAVAAVLQGFAALAGLLAFFYSIVTFTQTLKASHYGELDHMYFDLLRTVIDRPHLLDAQAKRSPHQQIEYDAYAFMVWNFLEAIVDRCRGDKRLCETWYPVIVAEDALHRPWFDDVRNRPKFKPSFREFIIQRKYILQTK